MRLSAEPAAHNFTAVADPSRSVVVSITAVALCPPRELPVGLTRYCTGWGRVAGDSCMLYCEPGKRIAAASRRPEQTEAFCAAFLQAESCPTPPCTFDAARSSCTATAWPPPASVDVCAAQGQWSQPSLPECEDIPGGDVCLRFTLANVSGADAAFNGVYVPRLPDRPDPGPRPLARPDLAPPAPPFPGTPLSRA